MHALTRRNFVAGAAASSSVIAGITAPKMVAAVQAGDDARLIDLCLRYREFDPVIEAAEQRHEEAYQRLIDVIGECPLSPVVENHRWHAAYSQSEAGMLENRAQAVRDRQCRIIDEIERLPAITIAGIVAKLELWNETHERYLDDNETLVMSAIDDLKALS